MLATALLSGCAHFWTPAPDVPVAMSPKDGRRTLAGTWHLEITVDTAMARPELDSAPPLATPRTAFGLIRITVTQLSKRRKDVLAFMSPSYRELVDSKGPIAAVYPAGISPLASGGRSIGIYRHRGRWVISLTPGVYDYGIILEGTLDSDSLSGAWMEESWGRILAAGKFVMRRAPSGSDEGLTTTTH